jgi:hypothetical protein
MTKKAKRKTKTRTRARACPRPRSRGVDADLARDQEIADFIHSASADEMERFERRLRRLAIRKLAGKAKP